MGRQPRVEAGLVSGESCSRARAFVGCHFMCVSFSMPSAR